MQNMLFQERKVKTMIQKNKMIQIMIKILKKKMKKQMIKINTKNRKDFSLNMVLNDFQKFKVYFSIN